MDNLNMDSGLDNSIVSILNSLILINVLWLNKRLPLFLVNIHYQYFVVRGCNIPK